MDLTLNLHFVWSKKSPSKDVCFSGQNDGFYQLCVCYDVTMNVRLPDEALLNDIDLDVKTEINIPVNFVGRDQNLTKIREAWSKHKIIGLFGLRSVGKSRLAKEAIQIFKSENDDIIEIDVNVFDNVDSFYCNICSCLAITPDRSASEDVYIQHIVRSLRSMSERQFLIFFDNAERSQEFQSENSRAQFRDTFLSLCSDIVEKCANVKILITSTSLIQFPKLQKTYFCHEVLPLNDLETFQLLQTCAGRVDFGIYKEPIVTLSEGLPLLILMIGSELSSGRISPQYMVECLVKSRLESLSKDFYADKYRVAGVYKKFLDRLEAIYKERLTVLDYIPGSFTAEHAKELLGADTTAMVKAETLLPIRRGHFLHYDYTKRRFNIQGILRECVKAYYTLRNISEIRARYCKIFSKVMTNISRRLGTSEYTQALAEFTIEHPNLQKLLTEVTYTKVDTYKFFIELVTNSTELIESFMPGGGEKFYEGCMKAADMFGQDTDKASVHIAVGSMYTNTMGYLLRGAENYQAALTMLQKNGNSLLLATAYQRIGWNMAQQSRNNEALGYYKKSLDISLISGKEYQRVAVQSLSSMGLSLVELGRFEEAEKCHVESLERRQVIFGNKHPSIGSCINNIGVMYEQMGDLKKALVYYIKGFQMKIETNAPISLLVMSYIDVSNIYISLGQFEEARNLLDEAHEKVCKESILHRVPIAYICSTRGKLYRSEGKLQMAEELFRKAADIRAGVASENVQYLESLVNLADISIKLQKFEACLKYANKALKLKEKINKEVPSSSLIAECLKCVADAYGKTNNMSEYIKTLEEIEFELLRLERVYLYQCNERAVERIQNQLEDIRHTLKGNHL